MPPEIGTRAKRSQASQGGTTGRSAYTTASIWAYRRLQCQGAAGDTGRANRPYFPFGPCHVGASARHSTGQLGHSLAVADLATVHRRLGLRSTDKRVEELGSTRVEVRRDSLAAAAAARIEGRELGEPPARPSMEPERVQLDRCYPTTALQGNFEPGAVRDIHEIAGMSRDSRLPDAETPRFRRHETRA
ncbi:hypothetical protein GQ53DRAFT_771397 [Thozetella sp. PMI_491]|nr:hypothetical protein GQ53DRAFT_771397 [Thozetella sp. PMI_491]